MIRNLLEQQQAHPLAKDFSVEETKGYLRCGKCGCSVHKRTNVNGPCLDQPYAKTHEGHASHSLWQKGDRVTCRQCGLQLHLDAQQRVILTGALKKLRKGSGISGSPPLSDFRRQVEQASHPDTADRAAQASPMTDTPTQTRPTSAGAPAGHDTQPLLVTPKQTQTPHLTSAVAIGAKEALLQRH